MQGIIFDLDETLLEQRRQRLKVLAYRRYPRRYADFSLEYIRQHSDQPRRDLTILSSYLRQRGLADRAAEIDRLLAPPPP